MVVCGSGERGGGGGERQRATKAVVAACGGGVRLFSVTRDGTLRGEMRIYVGPQIGMNPILYRYGDSPIWNFDISLPILNAVPIWG